MRAGAAALAVTLPLAADAMAAVPTGYPEIELSRSGTPHEWPFSVDAGRLACVPLGGRRVVIFSEPWREDVPQEFGDMTLPRSVIVSTNLFALLASIEDRDLYLPFDRIETLLARLAPFEAMGIKLCEEADASPQKKN